ncbi:MAG: hypothetical protein Q4F17_02365 [Eubacteriales bacterium]|nr:hypothetical protein [Eubacteriales bacterium]
MKKQSWYGVLFALLILFLYIMGTYDIFMMLSHNEAYYAGKSYGQPVVDYFTNYPVFGLVFWVGNLACGLLSPMMYLCRRKNADRVAMASFLCDFVLILWGAAFRNRLPVLGIRIFCFDLFILLVTLLFAVFLHCKGEKQLP